MKIYACWEKGGDRSPDKAKNDVETNVYREHLKKGGYFVNYRHLLACILILVCFGVGNVSLEGTGMAASSPLQVGVIVPLEGSWETLGHNSVAALEAARDVIEHYDDALAIELTVMNSASDPEKALKKMKLLEEQGIRIVIGPLSSEEVMAVQDFAKQHDMLLISPTATSSLLSEYEHIFRLAPNDRHQSNILSRAMNEQGIEELIVVHIDDVYGRTLLADLEEETEQYGIDLLSPVPVDSQDPDYARAVSLLEEKLAGQDLATTAVLLLESDTGAVEMIRAIPAQSEAANYKWYVGESITGSSLFLEDEVVRSFAARTEMEGFLVDNRLMMFASSIPLYEYMIRERLQEPLQASNVYSWDALWLTALTYRDVQDTDISLFREGLIQQSRMFTTAFHFSNPFNEHGDTMNATFSRLSFVEGEKTFDWDFVGLYEWSAEDQEWSYSDDPYITYTEDSGTIEIGALLPLSGDLARVGTEAREVLMMAKEVANDFLAKTGSGMQVALSIKDTQTQPQEAKHALSELYAQGITTFVGPYSSGEILAVQEFTEKNPVLIISPASTSPSLAPLDRLLRLAVTDAVLGQAWTRYLEHQNITDLIFLYRDELYGQDMASLMGAMFEGRIDFVPYCPEDLDVKGIVLELEELAATGTDRRALLAASHSEIAHILREVSMDSDLLNMPWYGTDITAQLDIMVEEPEAGKRASKVGYTATTFSHYGERVGTYTSILDWMMNTHISAFGSNSYDALWFIMEAVANVGLEATVEETWRTLTHSRAMLGLGGFHYFSEDWDRRTGNFYFHQLQEEGDSYEWDIIGVYENTREAIDYLNIY